MKKRKHKWITHLTLHPFHKRQTAEVQLQITLWNRRREGDGNLPYCWTQVWKVSHGHNGTTSSVREFPHNFSGTFTKSARRVTSTFAMIEERSSNFRTSQISLFVTPHIHFLKRTVFHLKICFSKRKPDCLPFPPFFRGKRAADLRKCRVEWWEKNRSSSKDPVTVVTSATHEVTPRVHWHGWQRKIT